MAGSTLSALAVGVALLGTRRRAGRLERVARATHELRGPIAAARLGVRMGVRLGALSGGRLRAVELELERAALALEDFCAAAGGRQAPSRLQEVRLAALVADCTEAWRPAAAARGGEIRVLWPSGEVVIHGDRLRLAQALDNLLANAIEHGEGTVEVRGRVDAGCVRVEVTDCGPGLPAPVAELSRRARRGRGLRGRGLVIASTIARDHGGRLAAAPSDRGARLLLELPLAGGEGAGRPKPARRPGA